MAMNIQDCINQAFRTAMEHGFHDEKASDEHWLMLVIGEVCEVMEAHRKGSTNEPKDTFEIRTNVWPDFNERYDAYVKGSMAEELADMCIRIFDFMGVNGISETELLSCTLTNDELSKCNENYTFTEQAFELIKCITQCWNEVIICHIVLEYAKYWANKFNIDLEWHIRTKMEYNRSRPMKHNKAY